MFIFKSKNQFIKKKNTWSSIAVIFYNNITYVKILTSGDILINNVGRTFHNYLILDTTPKNAFY